MIGEIGVLDCSNADDVRSVVEGMLSVDGGRVCEVKTLMNELT